MKERFRMKKFEGEISRNSTLSEVFSILKLSAVHFRVEGREGYCDALIITIVFTLQKIIKLYPDLCQ